eukprot:CAMPEP_0201596606 /NCGR_PEP_ID=MMETSP0190_2-20130828/193262_1 /ASSEMBLY_ACC=CAM_ASM_000263 /TAXON_ID=37353 /ORGANISM="Rosalina sp." /LENGTH=130 /DNA_ID=CAMNT_0048057065 /DNA_START=29 /DNA_END=418 /DNA_ORIENTATION=+
MSTIPTDDQKEESAAQVKVGAIVKENDKHWLNILNAADENGTADDFIEMMVSHFEGTLGFAGFLAGFQFIGIGGFEIVDDTSEVGLFIIVVALIISILSASLAIIELSWLRFWQGFPTTEIRKLVKGYYW